jgi:hypothetical protein
VITYDDDTVLHSPDFDSHLNILDTVLCKLTKCRVYCQRK